MTSKIWDLAKILYTRWYSAHGLVIDINNHPWERMDEWNQAYWYSVAEYVILEYKNYESS